MMPVTADPEIARRVDELTPLVCQFACSDYGIALGGAHAKGAEDSASDLDLYLFSGQVLSCDERSRVTTAFSADIDHVVSWGQDDPFTQGGTDFDFEGGKVECWLRHTDQIEHTIAECSEGIVRTERVTWTPTGFHHHCALSDVHAMLIIDDPAGILGRWKAAIEVYPLKLRRQIITTHLQAAAFWPANFHYNSAIERQDVIYTTSIVQQVVHNLVQVLFAVNETYFPGDKKLERSLGHLDRLPPQFVERMQRLIWPGEEASVTVLQEQQQELQDLLTETQRLVATAP